jgi:hypothetical protein
MTHRPLPDPRTMEILGEKTYKPIYGLIAEFDDPEVLLHATQASYDAGYRKMDAYTPFPVHGMEDALGLKRSRLPLLILLGGLFGGLAGYGLQYWASVINYPYNIAGRPLHSWPMFMPVTFETTVLFAAFAAVFGMLAVNGLPQPYHPVFNVPGFELASRNHFYLCIESSDPKFDMDETRRFLESVHSRKVSEVEF